jgi:hypothetical protein
LKEKLAEGLEGKAVAFQGTRVVRFSRVGLGQEVELGRGLKGLKP